MDIKVEITHLYKIIVVLFFAFVSVVGFLTKNFYSEFKEIESMTSSSASKIEILDEEVKELKNMVLMGIIKGK